MSETGPGLEPKKSQPESSGADKQKNKELIDQINKYRPDIIHFIKNELMKHGDRNIEDDKVEDIAQKTLLKANRLIDKFDSNKSALRTWLFMIARSTVLDDYQSRMSGVLSKIDYSVDFEEFLESKGSLDVHGDPLLRKRVVVAFGQLSSKDQEALTLFFLKGLPFDKITEKMNITAHSMRSKLSKAKAKLKLLLEKQGIKLDEL